MCDWTKKLKACAGKYKICERRQDNILPLSLIIVRVPSGDVIVFCVMRVVEAK